jgi:soluble lytic murein transglycosylase
MLKYRELPTEKQRPKRMKKKVLFIFSLLLNVYFVSYAQGMQECVKAVQSPLDKRWRSDKAFQKQCPIAYKVVTWLRLKEGGYASFQEYKTFIHHNPGWPFEFKIRKNAEEEINTQTPLQDLREWFSTELPKSLKATALYAEKLKEAGYQTQAAHQVRKAWQEITDSSKEQQNFLNRYQSILRVEDFEARLKMLLKEEDIASAAPLISFLPPQKRNIFQARIALISGKEEAEAPIHTSESFLEDPGVFYDYVKWLRKKYDPAAVQLVLDNKALISQDPDQWWRERSILSRRAFEDKNYALAYELIHQHGFEKGMNFADAEWFLGWVAFRFLGQNEVGLEHFLKMYQNVTSPISRSKAAYWIGRVYEAQGETEQARSWYQKASIHPTAYYGQLAAEKVGIKGKRSFLKRLHISSDKKAAFHKKDFVQAAWLLSKAGLSGEAMPFLYLLAKRASSNQERYLTLSLTSEIAPHYSLEVVKEVTPYTELPFFEAYPMIRKFSFGEIESSFAHAIIRKESGFNTKSVSPANARGLMQLIPSTAEKMAQKIKLRFNKQKLTEDPSYNVKLGCTYLKYLLDSYKGSYVLAIAAYNAGAKPVKEWVQLFGDPRDEGVDLIDWIEMISYPETRNYIQRVFEAWYVYKTALSSQPFS